MAVNIIDLIKGQLGPSLISQASTQLGESESGISKAISGILPAVLGGLVNNSSNPSVLDAITGAGSSGILSNLLGGSSNNSLISGLLSVIFGDKLNSIVSQIANFAGIGDTSSHSLLNLVTGASLGTLGKYASDNNIGPSGISSLLSEQKGLLANLVPAGLSLGSLGFGNLFDAGKETVETVKDKVTAEAPKLDYNSNNEGGSIWKWLLPLLLLLLAGWFLWKQCENKKLSEGTAVTTDSTSAATATSDSATVTTTAPAAKTDTEIDLNGIKLKGYANGMEEQMITFLKDGNYDKAADDNALKDTWYNFDKVTFKMGSSSELEPGSLEQLDNLVAILKAFPSSKIKIGGYTDKTGDEAVNVKISQARADFIKNYLTKAGVGSQVAGAEGYGSKFAKIDASASDEERAADRKMAVRFSK